MKQVTFLAVIGQLAIGGVAYASGHGGHGGTEAHFDWLRLALSWVNFAILLGIIVYVAKPMVKNLFANRSRQIREKLDEADRLRREAEDALRQYTVQLDELKRTREQQIASYRAEAMRERDEILAAAKHRIEKMQEDSEAALATQFRVAKEKLRDEIAHAIVTEAERIISREIRPEDQRRLVERTIESIGGEQ